MYHCQSTKQFVWFNLLLIILTLTFLACVMFICHLHWTYTFCRVYSSLHSIIHLIYIVLNIFLSYVITSQQSFECGINAQFLWIMIIQYGRVLPVKHHLGTKLYFFCLHGYFWLIHLISLVESLELANRWL